jgi:hypothetical protein
MNRYFMKNGVLFYSTYTLNQGINMANNQGIKHG